MTNILKTLKRFKWSEKETLVIIYYYTIFTCFSIINNILYSPGVAYLVKSKLDSKEYIAKKILLGSL